MRRGSWKAAEGTVALEAALKTTDGIGAFESLYMQESIGELVNLRMWEVG